MRFFTALLLTLGLGFQASAKAKEMKSFQVGAALKQYHYSEPSIAVSHTGLLYGFWGEWLWGSALGNGRTYGDLVFGTINYSGSLLGSGEPLEATTTDVIGKLNTRLDFTVAPGFGFFAGIGGRYLYDMGNGGSFYRRTGLWIFLPLGATVTSATSFGKVSLEVQYDHIVLGKFESRLSDVDANFPTINHSQTGYGLTVSAGLEFDNYSGAILYETWVLNESNAVEFAGDNYIEPENTGSSVGLKIGYRF